MWWVSEFGYKSTGRADPFYVRRPRVMPTMVPVAAAHNELFQGNVVFAIRLRTFAAIIVNGNLGSFSVIRKGT